MPLKKKLLITAVISLVLGAVAFGIGEIKTTAKPNLECVPKGQPTSGFSVKKDDGTDCSLSSAYVRELKAYERPAHKRPMRIVTTVLVLIGVSAGIAGLVVRQKK